LWQIGGVGKESENGCALGSVRPLKKEKGNAVRLCGACIAFMYFCLKTNSGADRYRL
jgi:hypothetical protein